jgi:hypothetical protein
VASMFLPVNANRPPEWRAVTHGPWPGRHAQRMKSIHGTVITMNTAKKMTPKMPPIFQ